MSLNEENRRIVIQLELERVNKMLTQVDGLNGKGLQGQRRYRRPSSMKTTKCPSLALLVVRT